MFIMLVKVSMLQCEADSHINVKVVAVVTLNLN